MRSCVFLYASARPSRERGGSNSADFQASFSTYLRVHSRICRRSRSVYLRAYFYVHLRVSFRIRGRNNSALACAYSYMYSCAPSRIRGRSNSVYIHVYSHMRLRVHSRICGRNHSAYLRAFFFCICTYRPAPVAGVILRTLIRTVRTPPTLPSTSRTRVRILLRIRPSLYCHVYFCMHLRIPSRIPPPIYFCMQV